MEIEFKIDLGLTLVNILSSDARIGFLMILLDSRCNFRLEKGLVIFFGNSEGVLAFLNLKLV